ncbi:MAG TPA: type II secretion system F family protein [Symbiobacteriaceae bacterium]|jgi:type IV pilus assembly protein PilC|nr:type II secretion system F family protein [Symbiobacteriaceae bacterium]
MSAFVYRVRDPAGQMVRGRAEADTEHDLIQRLRNQGFLVLDIQKDRDLGTMVQSPVGLFTPRVSGKDLAVFSRQFATMINAGLPVLTALKVLSRQSGSKRLSHALSLIATEVEAGESLSAAFLRQINIFPPVMVHMIAAGEVGGILDEVLERLAVQIEKEELIRQKVRSALVYPAIVSSVAVLVVAFLMIFVVPKFVAIYADMEIELPFATKMLMAISNGFQRFWWVGALAIVGGIFGLRWWLRTEQGALFWAGTSLKLPIMGPMVSKQAIGRFARTLGGLLSSGVSILKALAVVEKTVGNVVISGAIRDTAEAVRQGQRLAEPLRASGHFPDMVLEMVNVGEETGTVEEMLIKISDFYDDEVQRTAERLSASIEPVIIVFLAITVGGIVISMMVPIFTLWSSIG